LDILEEMSKIIIAPKRGCKIQAGSWLTLIEDFFFVALWRRGSDLNMEIKIFLLVAIN